MVCTGRPPPFTNRVDSARIYEFQVTRSGQIGGYALVPGGDLGIMGVSDLAVTPNGSEIAVIAWPLKDPASWARTEIIVINTRTGARAIWRNAAADSHGARFRFYRLSFVDGGQDLAFFADRTCGAGTHPGLCKPADEQIRTLSGPETGGVLSTSRLLLAVKAVATAEIDAAVVSNDGTAVTFVTESTPGSPQPSTLTVVQLSLRTGGRRVIYQIRGRHEAEDFLSPDAQGRHFIISAGSTDHHVFGWIDNGRLIALKPYPYPIWVYYEAW